MVSKGGRWRRERTPGREEGEEGTGSSVPGPSPHTPRPWSPSLILHPRKHLVLEEVPMGEGREIRGTGRSLGQTSQGIDLTGPSILVFVAVDGVSRSDGGVEVKEVLRLQ